MTVTSMLQLPLASAPPRLGTAGSKGPIVLGLVTLYVVWGATYLAIHTALESFPPLFLIAGRSLLAGAALLGSAFAGGCRWPTRREWYSAVVLGTLFFVFCHGVLAVAQQRVPSGLAALLMATIPLWVPLVGRIGARGQVPRARTVAAIGIGFIGVTILLVQTRGILWGGADGFYVLALLLAALSWATGTVASRVLVLPASPVQAAGMELLVGGGILLAVSTASGELAQLSAATVSARSLVGFGYLTLFGSVVGFSVYTWLLGVTTPDRVATCAYVNPVVAVFLGAIFLGEPLTASTMIAAAIIVGTVAVTVSDTDCVARSPPDADHRLLKRPRICKCG
jgi:drug/metabolite transporter (DMT)-like permease